VFDGELQVARTIQADNHNPTRVTGGSIRKPIATCTQSWLHGLTAGVPTRASQAAEETRQEAAPNPPTAAGFSRPKYSVRRRGAGELRIFEIETDNTLCTQVTIHARHPRRRAIARRSPRGQHVDHEITIRTIQLDGTHSLRALAERGDGSITFKIFDGEEPIQKVTAADAHALAAMVDAVKPR
jgi:hypothetical protein